MTNPFPVFFLIALLGTGLNLYLNESKRNRAGIVETLLLYQLIFSVGLNGIFAFYGHAFLSDKVAEYIGWSTGSPFQLEVAYTNLAFGILGILCLFIGNHFWTATVLGISIWYLADAFGHIRDYIINSNAAPGNIGLPLYIDIFLPVLLLVLLGLHLWLGQNRSSFLERLQFWK